MSQYCFTQTTFLISTQAFTVINTQKLLVTYILWLNRHTGAPLIIQNLRKKTVTLANIVLTV